MTAPVEVWSDVSLFTGKERDAETGLDYFGARYMSAAQGRSTSPDAPFADQHEYDPQSWNLYAYVRNRPLTLIDPTGNCSKKGGPDDPATDDPGEPCVAPGSTSVTVVLNDSLDPLEVVDGFIAGRLPGNMTFSEDSKLSLELVRPGISRICFETSRRSLTTAAIQLVENILVACKSGRHPHGWRESRAMR